MIFSIFAFGLGLYSLFLSIRVRKNYLKFISENEEAILKANPLCPVGFKSNFKCPSCGYVLSDYVLDDYCRHCGQAIYWLNAEGVD